MKMTPEELKAKLDAHKLWLETRGSDEVKGERLNLADADLTRAYLADADLTRAYLADADLTDADLAGADLAGADLTGADLAGADLAGADLACADLACANLACADLACADLACANLACANLACANLACADLTHAYLAGANLTRANLACADLTRANLDYSGWPLKCSTLNVKIDKRLAAQLMYHTMRAMRSCSDDADVAAVLASPECVALASQFHCVEECGRLEVLGNEGEKVAV